ncbi:MAG: hypothetical protein JSS60_04170 [Verrucomicrobia bacterium]|nr:hypothetical protein [Verrucomicrobiota bacterium]
MTNRGPVFQNPHAVVFARQTGALQPVQVFAPVDVQFTPPEATARGILDAGNRSLAQGDFDSALHLYRQGLAFASRAPQNQTIGDVIIDLCIREGLVLLKTGKSPIDALAVYFKGMQVPHCSAARKCILWANIGKAQMQIADYYPAIASFEKSLESQQISSQNRAKWNFYIGHCYVQSGNLQLGIQHFNYGLQVEGASAETRALLQNHMGTAYLKMGMMAEAKSYLYQTVSNPAGVPPDLIAEASVFLSDILRNESRTLIENASQLPNLSRELKAILGQKLEKL